MLIIGCDVHTRFQQIAMVDTTTDEIVERRLEHEVGEARAFYAALPSPVRVGIEATGHAQWFERMLGEQGHELWVGSPALIRANEAAQAASQFDPELRRDYQRMNRRGSAVAKVPVARKLVVQLYWMLWEAGQPSAAGSRAGQLGHFRGGPPSIDKMMERPASPCNRKGSSESESWSGIEDRIDGWWEQRPP